MAWTGKIIGGVLGSLLGPLGAVVGVGIGENFLASDQMALRQVTDRFIYLEEGDLVRTTPSSLEIIDHGLGFDPQAALGQRGHLGLAGMAEQAADCGAVIKTLAAKSVKPVGAGFEIETRSETFGAGTVVLAMGTAYKKLGVPGESEFIGRGVSYCATCDGPFFREFVVELPVPAHRVKEELGRAGIWPGISCGCWYDDMENCLLVSVTERHTRADIDSLASAVEAA